MRSVLILRTSTLAVAAAGFLVAHSAAALQPADPPACGAAASSWNVPNGALVLSTAGEGMVGAILMSIGESNGHSMISHGSYSMSHATRTEDDISDNESFWNGCSMPIEPGPLTAGNPGAERIDMPGAYAFLEKNAPIINNPQSNQWADLEYQESIAWPNTVVAPGECINARQVSATTIACDPIPGCSNPHVDLRGIGSVTCDPIANCSNSPYMIGNLIACSADQSSCDTGGHIDTTSGAFQCQPLQTSYTCTQWQTTGDPDQPRICKHWVEKTFNPETPTRTVAKSNAPPSTTIPYNLTNQDDQKQMAFLFRRVSADGADVANYLQSIDFGAAQPYQYGYPYDFSQFTQIGGVNYGQVDSQGGHGVVCSTFLSWAHFNAKKPAIAAHTYASNLIATATNTALFPAAFAKCQDILASKSDAKRAEISARCGGLDPVCHAAARQAVNCFSSGRCDSDDEDLYKQASEGHISAYSISPDRLGGLGLHNPNTDRTNTSVWATDFSHSVQFSNPGVYACWHK